MTRAGRGIAATRSSMAGVQRETSHRESRACIESSLLAITTLEAEHMWRLQGFDAEVITVRLGAFKDFTHAVVACMVENGGF